MSNKGVTREEVEKMIKDALKEDGRNKPEDKNNKRNFKSAMSPTNKTPHNTAGEINVEDKPLGKLDENKISFLKQQYLSLTDRQSDLLQRKGSMGYNERKNPMDGSKSEHEKIMDELTTISKKKESIYNEIKNQRRNLEFAPKIFDD